MLTAYTWNRFSISIWIGNILGFVVIVSSQRTARITVNKAIRYNGERTNEKQAAGMNWKKRAIKTEKKKLLKIQSTTWPILKHFCMKSIAPVHTDITLWMNLKLHHCPTCFFSANLPFLQFNFLRTLSQDTVFTELRNLMEIDPFWFLIFRIFC